MLKRVWIAAVLSLVLGAPAWAQRDNNPSFYLVNRSNSAINEVYATTANTRTWGRDRLANESIAPGQSYPIRLPADGNCMYDIKVVYANGQTEERRSLNTCRLENVVFPSGNRGGGGSADSGRSQQATSDPSFRLINRGRSEIQEVYASLADNDSWGEDRLGNDTVPTGGSKVIRLPNGDCMYDVRVVFANGEATERRRLNLCNITDLRVP